MGLTIFYSGKLRSPILLDALVKEASDACMYVGWPFSYLKRSNIMPMKGIIINPQGSEPIMLSFIEDGTLADPHRFMLWEDPQSLEVNLDEDGICFTKTQYAGADAHMAIIKFLRYISEKFFSSFRLEDESGYWNQNDDEACRKRFGEPSLITDSHENVLNSLLGYEDEDEDEDDYISYSAEIDEWIKERIAVN